MISYRSLSDGAPSNGKHCLPARHVAYLKTHKCASTTIQNIFLRHAHFSGLRVAWPQRANYLSRMKKFNATEAFGEGQQGKNLINC